MHATSAEILSAAPIGGAGVADQLRRGFRQVASSVAVITCGASELAVAMTATAFTSVTLDPPTVLVCVNRSTRLHAAVLKVGGFRVNVLDQNQEDVARACCGGDLHSRFRVGDWRHEQGPGPRLVDSLFDVACRVRDIIESGSHTVFIGEVEAVTLGEGRPLLYADGDFARSERLMGQASA